MIDTDKYEWDSKCRMVVIDGELYQRGSNGDYHLSLYDKSVAQLIADAPLLLEEVMRLREGIVNALIPTDTNPIIHPLTTLSDLRDALKGLIE